MQIIRAIPVDTEIKPTADISTKGPHSHEAESQNNTDITTTLPPANDENELKRAPPPGGFYTFSGGISCATASRVREIWDAMARAPVRHARNWHQLDLEIGADAVNQIIYDTQRWAYECYCTKLPLIGGDAPGWKLRAIHTSENCKTEEVARMLEKVYGCGCFNVYTRGGDEIDGISTGGDAGGLSGSLLLDGISDDIQKNMRTTPLDGSAAVHFGKKPPKSHAGFSDFDLGDYAAGRQLVPGTKEPYWLSGPEEFPRGSGRSLNALKSRLGGMGELYKRVGDIEPRSTSTADAELGKVSGKRVL
ncbi:hypothetical protein TWF106_011172 [Orbilia oligospora]|uniref:Uncharacterized protein n=1 Tax=Orbilia oligospora TaxID=2813651 RepID=A0A7C8V330_ORBOL|nr:hypothetical protein TWF106_011172 [Orbilia oligospora]